MTRFDLNGNDMGFKILDNKNYPDHNARLSELPFIFKRSEIDNALKTVPPLTLYLRNNTRTEDYIIVFSSPEDLTEFKDFFPDVTYNQPVTDDYYHIRH